MHLPETTQLKTGSRFWNSFLLILPHFPTENALELAWSSALCSWLHPLAPMTLAKHVPVLGTNMFSHSIMVRALGFVSGSVHLSPSSSTD